MSKKFKNLSKSLDTDFKENEKSVSKKMKQLNQLVEKKENLLSTDLTKVELKDMKFMEKEIKNCINSINTVMEKLEEDIRIGSPPRMYEVFSDLARTKVGSVRELRLLQETISEIKFKMMNQDSGNGGTINNNNVFISSSDMTQLIKKAKKNSSVNKIEPNFDLEDSEDIL